MSKKSKQPNVRRRNTVADNCVTKVERNFCGYYLKDCSFVVVAGGTGYTAPHCNVLKDALQGNYMHALTVIDGDRFDATPKTYDTRKGGEK